MERIVLPGWNSEKTPSVGDAEAGPGVVTIYGIRNCDTMKKARAWLDGNGIAYRFHDYKKDGLTRAKLEGWSGKLGWEALLNRGGTTFRTLPEAGRADLTEARAIALMLDQPSMIRRPVLQAADCVLVGFSPGRLRPGARIDRNWHLPFAASPQRIVSGAARLSAPEDAHKQNGGASKECV